MIEFICIFFPGLIAAGRCDLKRDINKLIVNYGGYTIFINIFTIWIMHSIGLINGDMLNQRVFGIKVSLIYALIATALAFVLPTIINYIKDHFKINFRKVNRNEKSIKKDTKIFKNHR